MLFWIELMVDNTIICLNRGQHVCLVCAVGEYITFGDIPSLRKYRLQIAIYLRRDAPH